MSGIASEEYVSLTTFTKDGRPKPAPVWIVDLGDGKAGFTTGSDSWKIKRIKNTPGVTLQPCNQKGKINEGTEVVKATAWVGSDRDFERVNGLVKEKYGIWVPIMKTVGKVRSLMGKGQSGDACVMLSLD